MARVPTYGVSLHAATPKLLLFWFLEKLSIYVFLLLADVPGVNWSKISHHTTVFLDGRSFMPVLFQNLLRIHFTPPVNQISPAIITNQSAATYNSAPSAASPAKILFSRLMF